MTNTPRPSARDFRTGANRAAYEELLREVARAARLTPTAELKALNLDKKHVSILRNGHPDYFGWDRLHKIALALGVPISPIWAKHEKREKHEGVAA